VAKTASMQRPLAAIGRGAILPYFGKRGEIWTYYPQEQKRAVLRAFPVLTGLSEREKEPDLGVFCCIPVTRALWAFAWHVNKPSTMTI